MTPSLTAAQKGPRYRAHVLTFAVWLLAQPPAYRAQILAETRAEHGSDADDVEAAMRECARRGGGNADSRARAARVAASLSGDGARLVGAALQ